MTGKVPLNKRIRKDLRITVHAALIMKAAKDKLGIGESQVIELALRKFAEANQITTSV
jgi:hypothetical protein